MCVCVCVLVLSILKNYPTAVHYDFQLKSTYAGKDIQICVCVSACMHIMHVCVCVLNVKYTYVYVFLFIWVKACAYMQPVGYARAHIFS